jgi:DNA polymerase-3 subunit alpha
VMRILERLGGIELSSAYTCIKAISKKKHETIAAFREQFVEGAKARGLGKVEAEDLFGLIEKFAGYGFNKSHSTAYALLAWQTAYLKTHHPVEFMAALLSGDIPGRNFKKKDAVIEHIEDCRRMGIPVGPPDVNRSGVDFTVEDRGIRFGLSAVKGCGVQAADAICVERQANGSFRDLYDLCGRVDPSVVNKTALENLAKAGGLDSLLGPAEHRGSLLAAIERAMSAGASRIADRRSGQKSLFDALEDVAVVKDASPDTTVPDAPPLSDAEMRSFEKEVLGYYVHSHPLAEYQGVLRAISTHGSADISTAEPRSEVVMGGMVGALKLSNTKQPRPGSSHTRYGMFDLEDMDGLVRSICWPEEYAALGDFLVPDAVIVVAGSVDRRTGSEETNLIINDIVPITEIWSRPARGLTIKVLETMHDANTFDRLVDILMRHPGDVPLRLLLELVDGRRVLMDVDGRRVTWSKPFFDDLVELLGAGALRASVAVSTGRRQDKPAARGGRKPDFQRA